jgi:hypothetical protein
MITRFKNDDYGFACWLRDNPAGYVFNDFGGPNVANKALHESSCRLLRHPGGIESKTITRKICSSNLDELLKWVDESRGPEGEGYSPCTQCNPFIGKRGADEEQEIVALWK